MKIKSPLRYPGGKSKAVKTILKVISYFEEYREPMVGGGSIFFAIKQEYPKKKYWINDKNRDLILFWKSCRDNPKKLIKKILELREKYPGKKLYEHLKKDKSNDLDIAARFFILNRITYSGLIETGGYSKQAYEKRFTKTSIDRILLASRLLKGVKITNYDYKKVIEKKGKKVFIFFDPPYYSKTKWKLYGKDGCLHTKFKHKRFFDNIRKCKYNWLITYDNCPKINELFTIYQLKNWKKKNWKLQYGSNNKKNEKQAKKGEELLILNYKK